MRPLSSTLGRNDTRVSKNEFRKDFCKMMQDSGLLDGEISRDELYDEDELIEICSNDFPEEFRIRYS